MRIGIDASRAFVKERTGIEEYSYQVIKHLENKLANHQVILYIRKNQKINFDLPDNWQIKIINCHYLWTQLGLSLEMLFHPVDVLFIPAHVVPIIHPRNTVVTIHGLEFEIFPEGYAFWARLYMHWSIRMSCKWAKKIIAVSENTKKDLIKLYDVPEKKIKVVYEGVSDIYNSSSPVYGRGCPEGTGEGKNKGSSLIRPSATFSQREKGIFLKPYLLFIGRLEKRKNIEGIIEAYKILKEKYNIPHSLILAGDPGFGFEIIKLKIENCKLKIINLGYVDEFLKWQLLSNTDIFLFPTFYEGFGLPILEAQSMGVPVVASNISSLPEISGNSVIYCDPQIPEAVAEATYKLISNEQLKNDIINKGYENVKRFNWAKCAEQVATVLGS